MLLLLNHFLGRLLRSLPKYTKVRRQDMEADFFIPPNCHYVCDDLTQIKNGQREPHLYDWLNNLGENATLFDVGTSYGQEISLASSLTDRNVKVVGFDCGLYHSHFCCLNKVLNGDRFQFVFAAVSDVTGKRIRINTNSDTHLAHLHKKNVPYSYDVLTLALDDFAKDENLFPTHLKIDVDGAETSVIKGAHALLSSDVLQDVFIEIDHENEGIFNTMKAYGFDIVWEQRKAQNIDVLFTRTQPVTKAVA
ncbi:FkbM family methyltransferase [Alphaproteobacteria bacterium]|nr:FkbM family methyltransferase [Alphaproteobacteria bacterium]